MVQHNTIDHSGLTGVPSLSYGSNANAVSAASAAGASTLVSRADHVHVGTTSISHTSNTYSGPITLVAQGAVGITSPSAGTFSINAVAGSGGGAAATTVVPAHGCRVKRITTGFSVGNNTLTAIEFNSEDFDTDTMHDNSSSPTRLTIPAISGVTTGLWRITASSYFDQTIADLAIRVDGTTTISFQRASNGLGSCFTAVDYVLAAAQYVEVLGRTTAGAGNAALDAGVSPIFSAIFLGKVT